MLRKKNKAEGVPKRHLNYKNIAVGIVLGVGVFWLGILVGQGKIGPNAVFHKSENKTLPANLDYSSVEKLYDSLKSNYDGQLDVNKLLDGLKTGIANAAGDPYTEYLNADQAKQFSEDLNGTFDGIGAELGKDDNKNVIIMTTLPGTPAEKSGLHAKDVIAEINGKSAAGIAVDAAKGQIRGPKGTQVKLKVVRDGSVLEFNITRDTITVPSVTSKILDGNIGYLQVSRFGEDTSAAAKAAAQKFKDAGVKGVVLDVRSDPGGLLDAAVDVSSLWLNNKTVLTERRGGQVVQAYSSHGTAILAGIPTVVLIDDGSASASEITAGALRDNKVATLMGVKSFGKGSVQQLVKFLDGSELKVTIARWYTPNGKNIDKEGIEPDKKIDRSDDDIKAGRDPQLAAALEFLKK